MCMTEWDHWTFTNFLYSSSPFKFLLENGVISLIGIKTNKYISLFFRLWISYYVPYLGSGFGHTEVDQTDRILAPST